jgi:hypothetical protein
VNTSEVWHLILSLGHQGRNVRVLCKRKHGSVSAAPLGTSISLRFGPVVVAKDPSVGTALVKDKVSLWFGVANKASHCLKGFFQRRNQEKWL